MAHLDGVTDSMAAIASSAVFKSCSKINEDDMHMQLCFSARVFSRVTGQLADKPTRGQSSRGLVNSRLVNSPKCLILKFGVYDSS